MPSVYLFIYSMIVINLFILHKCLLSHIQIFNKYECHIYWSQFSGRWKCLYNKAAGYIPVKSSDKHKMSGSLAICTVSDDIQDKLKNFRFSKETCTRAIIFKIVKDEQQLQIDECLEDCTLEDISTSLPPQQPRYILISYRREYKDGRINFPLALLYYSPPGCNPELQMMYAGSLNNLATAAGLAHTIELRDLDEFTDEFLLERLGK